MDSKNEPIQESKDIKNTQIYNVNKNKNNRQNNYQENNQNNYQENNQNNRQNYNNNQNNNNNNRQNNNNNRQNYNNNRQNYNNNSQNYNNNRKNYNNNQNYNNNRQNNNSQNYNNNNRQNYNNNRQNYNNKQQNYQNNNYEQNENNNIYDKSNSEKKNQEQEQESEPIKKEEYDDPNTMTPENIIKREKAVEEINTFDDLSELIDLKIIRGVMSYGFEEPSPIQKKAIKPLLSKFDLIAQAQSGTGKTATFCIGTLGRIDFTKNETQAIILAHTLELAQQIEHVFTNIGKYTDLRLATAAKSLTVRENIETLLGRNNPDGLLPHVVIGTPGRVLDMINKEAINIETIRLLVCDEADELLSEGFIAQIKQIIGSIGEQTQIALFSATMDASFFKLTEKFLRNPINILIKKENLTLEGIKQFYIDCEKNDFKFETLCDLYGLFSTCQTIIYCNHHQSVEILTQKMQEQDFKVSYIHGGMNISEREEAMKKFRNLTTRVLISTDLLGRGIDVQQVSIVINYDIPFKSEAYIHRIGRSGRHGRTGTAINFVTNNDIKRVHDIETYYHTRILPLPSDMADVFQSNI
jgi:translation initiation factor 4A